MSAKNSEEFNVLQFEKKLTSLKDSQESINNCCQWCLSNRQHHKKIVNSWLNVLKRVKVEHRLILFYLANDVIQYSKRKKIEYVESWGTALQKATTLVRDDKVKQKILRIFKIWEDRSIYSEEFIADLCGLISVTPTAPKNDEPHEFQASYVINKIRVCSNLENDTDVKLKQLNELHPKVLETESYYTSLKDRAHLDDAEKDLDSYVNSMENYINALKVEIKNRINLISVLKQAEGQLDTDRKDVKVVANAYKAYGTRVKTFQKKLEEHKATLSSPIPSPDVNAPSPTSDSDIELPDPQMAVPRETQKPEPAKTEIDLTNIQITNANYYNPVPAPTTESSTPYMANGFTSFMGSNLPFNVQNFNPSELFNSNPATTAPQTTNSNFGDLSSVIPSLNQQIPSLLQPTPPLPPKTEPFPYSSNAHSIPLLPPPMPPFAAKEDANFANTGNYEAGYENEAVSDYGPPSFNANTSYGPESNFPPTYSNAPADSSYDPISTLFSAEPTFETPAGANPYPPSEEYNPEEELQTWEGDLSWTQPPPLDNTDTPESPPPFEKEAFGDPIEYHDNMVNSGATDVDHRVLPSGLAGTGKSSGRSQDVDHRNLISLIGSPATDSNSNQLGNNDGWSGSDQDYRQTGDKDYRLPFDIGEQLKLPPPPPPPPNSNMCPIPVLSATNHSKKMGMSYPQDIVESIDMDLSDDEKLEGGNEVSSHSTQRDNLRVVIDGISTNSNSNSQSLKSPIDQNSCSNSQDGSTPFSSGKNDVPLMLEPPPPLPDLPDDAEENLLLDQMNNDINDFLLNSEELEENMGDHFWSGNDMANLQPPPMFQHMPSIPPPPMAPPQWMGDQPPSFQQSYNNGPYSGGKQFKRNKFTNNRGRTRAGFGGNFNDNYPNRGGGNSFQRRGRGNPRFPKGNHFRGNMRGHRGGY